MAYPKIINIMLASVDGKISSHPHESTAERKQKQFTCSTDFERMRGLVARCSTVFIGAKSLEVEKGAFRVAHLTQTGVEPEWIVFTQSNNINEQHPFWQQRGIPKALFHMASDRAADPPILAVERMGEITKYTGNLAGLLEHLRLSSRASLLDPAVKPRDDGQNGSSIALLGGGKLNAVFWQQGLVSELYLTISPHLIGNGAQTRPLIDSQTKIDCSLNLLKVDHTENFIFLDYKVIPGHHRAPSKP